MAGLSRNRRFRTLTPLDEGHLTLGPAGGTAPPAVPVTASRITTKGEVRESRSGSPPDVCNSDCHKCAGLVVIDSVFSSPLQPACRADVP